MNFDELVQEPTCTPIRGTEPTTMPDSVLVKNKFSETVTLLSPETLHSDHLGIMVNTSFPFGDVKVDDDSVYEYYEYDSISKDRKCEIWTEVSATPSFNEANAAFGQLTLMCKRVRKGGVQKKNNTPIKDINQEWTENIKHDEKTICDVGRLFKISNRLRGTLDQVTSASADKKLSRRENRHHLRQFRKAVSGWSKLSHDQELKYRRIVDKCLDELSNSENFRFTIDEFKTELENLKTNAAEGPDRISKHLFPEKLENQLKLLWMFNDMIFREKYLPKKLLRSRLIFVDKKQGSKKRPICLGSRVIALLDKMVATRISKLVDADPKFANTFGYRDKLGCEEYFGTFIHQVSEWQNKGEVVGVLQCDVQSAFTSVQHKRLVIAMFEFVERSGQVDKPYYLVAYVYMWLQNRVVLFEKTFVLMKSGVPQGSTLSPVVFLVFLDYECGENATVYKFADDCTILIHAKTVEEVKSATEVVWADFEKWLKSKDMACEPSKSSFMILNKTKPTIEKHFDKVTVKTKTSEKLVTVVSGIPVVYSIKILGITVDSKLNFIDHVGIVCNMLRTRINCLSMMKGLGLNISHAIQFALCVRSILHFGLWHLSKISENQWSRLERVWNKLLRTALHQHCPDRLPTEILYKLTGVCGFRDFSEYLMNLRLVKISNPNFTKCVRFTLNFDEKEEISRFVSSTVRRGAVRISTLVSTLVSKSNSEQGKLLEKLGPIKTYLYYLAKRRDWTECDFTLEKQLLRAKYEVSSAGISDEIKNLNTHSLKEKLISFCKVLIYNYMENVVE